MKLTIIVPTYNCEATIEECVRSIVAQTRQDFEVLFIDGNSTDATLAKLRRATVGRPNLSVSTAPDAGIYDAMNKAIGRARGEWLYFLGSDDALNGADTLAQVIPQLTGDLDILYGDVLYQASSGETHVYDGAFTPGKLARRNVCHQSVFYRATLFERLGAYDLRYPVFADWAFNLRAFPRARTRHLSQIIARCFLGGRSSTNPDPNFFNDKLDMIFDNTPAMLNQAYAYNLRRLMRMIIAFWNKRDLRRMLRASNILVANSSLRLLGVASRLP